MKTEFLRTDHSIALSHAQDVLNHGGLVVFPTDTVYGLAASLAYPQAVEGLYLIKGQTSENSVAVLIGDVQELPRIAQTVSWSAQRLVDRFWPGPLTLLLPGNPVFYQSVVSHGVVGVRMPDHAFALALLQQTGPLAVTSASLYGKEQPRTAGEALKQLNGRVHLVLDGGVATLGKYSTVVDCCGPQAVLARKGAISEEEILAAIKPGS